MRVGWYIHSKSNIVSDNFKDCQACQPHQSKQALGLSNQMREGLLMYEYDMPWLQFVDAVRESMHIKSQQSRTIVNIHVPRFELLLVNISTTIGCKHSKPLMEWKKEGQLP